MQMVPPYLLAASDDVLSRLAIRQGTKRERGTEATGNPASWSPLFFFAPQSDACRSQPELESIAESLVNKWYYCATSRGKIRLEKGKNASNSPNLPQQIHTLDQTHRAATTWCKGRNQQGLFYGANREMPRLQFRRLFLLAGRVINTTFQPHIWAMAG